MLAPFFVDLICRFNFVLYLSPLGRGRIAPRDAKASSSAIRVRGGSYERLQPLTSTLSQREREHTFHRGGIERNLITHLTECGEVVDVAYFVTWPRISPPGFASVWTLT